MQYRNFGRTGWKVSDISLGTWQVGGGWRDEFDANMADDIITCAIEQGVNFIDTADVYSAGLSEQAVGKAVRRQQKKIFVATKCGRQITPHTNEGYTPQRLIAFVEQSLVNSGLEHIDLIQLHCPPTEVYERDEIFSCFDALQAQGKIGHVGVSVATIEEAHRAIMHPSVVSIQIIYNIFRQRPRDQFFAHAAEKNIAVIVRVPLASGMLSGKFALDSSFAADDHRHFNRQGKAFDKGETFSGVPYAEGIAAANALRPYLEASGEMAQGALRWILDAPQVSCIIPGASKVAQVRQNCNVSELPALSAVAHTATHKIYDTHIRQHVHHLW